MKKVTGEAQKKHYESIDQSTGEITNKLQEYTDQSRNPGIAREWLRKWQSDVYPSDTIIHNGHIMKPPAYYDNIFAIDNSVELNSLKEARKTHMRKHSFDIMPHRLAQREIVKQAQINQLKRGFK